MGLLKHLFGLLCDGDDNVQRVLLSWLNRRSNTLTARIIKATWALINSEDSKIFQDSLQNNSMFPLSRLLEHMFMSSLKIIDIVTTNYDRLAEYACDQGRIHHYTGFTHGYFRQLAVATEITAARRVTIWKVHGRPKERTQLLLFVGSEAAATQRYAITFSLRSTASPANPIPLQ
jgi:hypothetical protein